MLKTESLSRWISEDTLMIAKPSAKFNDKNLIIWGSTKLGYKLQEEHQFTMEAIWKDEKYYGEGSAHCTGQFINMENYYFSKILLKVIKPRKQELIILDANKIDF